MGKVNRPPPKYKATRRPLPDLREVREDIDRILAANSRPLDGGCREWTGWKNRLGYGQLYWKGKYWGAHRAAYCAHHGPFNEWLDVRHSCDNPACVAIEHLSIGTRSDNMRDAVDRKRSKNAKKTHCPKGHSYEEHGALIRVSSSTYKPWRRCKVCDAERARSQAYVAWRREYQKRRREAKRPTSCADGKP